INTSNNANIDVLGGYGEINITNNTNYDLVINDVDVSQRGAGTLIIKDLAKGGTDTNPYTTTYTRDANGVTTITETGKSVLTTSGAVDYDPQTGLRYGWQVGQELFTRQYKTEGNSSWLGIDFLARDPATVVFDGPEERIGTPKLQGEGAYVYVDTGLANTAYVSSFSNVNVATPEVKLIDSWTTSTWYGKKTYYSKFVKETKKQDIYTHSIKADYSIDINFLGSSEATVNVNSTGTGDVLLVGGIYNTTGNTSIQSQGAIEGTRESIVQGNRIVLTAGSNIGSANELAVTGGVITGAATPLRIDLNAHASAALKATTSNGNIHIKEISGDLSIDSVYAATTAQLSAGTGSEITLESTSAIVTASGKTGLIQGSSVTLLAEGAIGTSSQHIILNSGETLNDDVVVYAKGDVYLTESAGDLRLKELVASNQGTKYDVTLKVNDGQLADANNSATRDERTVAQLTSGVWGALGLTAATGANDKI
ncbi:MAG: hypothetical protein ACPGPF_09910, partial [Pontibacterium sp.]